MFKKLPIIFLVCLIVCIGTFAGFFFGRASAGSMFPISGDDNQSKDSVVNYSKNGLKLDLNTATVQELTDIPGVTKKIAKAIIQYRDDYGKYYSVSELKDIDGIDSDLYKTIKEYITVSN